MFRSLKTCLLAIGLILATVAPVQAQYGYNFRAPARFSDRVKFEGQVNLGSSSQVSGAGTGKVTNQYANSSNNRTYTIPDAGAAASYVMTEGAQTINGVKTFGSAPTITGGLTAANIQTGSAKRELLIAKMCPAGGAAASNSTVYFQNVYPGRACSVKRITYGTNVDPVSGTNTIKVLKNGAAGNTMLSTASVSLNGATANVGQNATLTATGADLILTATGSIYCEYSAGTQGAAAKDVTAVIEIEPDDF